MAATPRDFEPAVRDLDENVFLYCLEDLEEAAAVPRQDAGRALVQHGREVVESGLHVGRLAAELLDRRVRSSDDLALGMDVPLLTVLNARHSSAAVLGDPGGARRALPAPG